MARLFKKAYGTSCHANILKISEWHFFHTHFTNLGSTHSWIRLKLLDGGRNRFSPNIFERLPESCHASFLGDAQISLGFNVETFLSLLALLIVVFSKCFSKHNLIHNYNTRNASKSNYFLQRK